MGTARAPVTASGMCPAWTILRFGFETRMVHARHRVRDVPGMDHSRLESEAVRVGCVAHGAKRTIFPRQGKAIRFGHIRDFCFLGGRRCVAWPRMIDDEIEVVYRVRTASSGLDARIEGLLLEPSS